MESLKFVAIIPARYASTRFPGKPLVDLGGKPMIERVYEEVKLVLNDVIVATDDVRIFDVVISFGGKAVMTSEKHTSGTDRCYEAFTKLENQFDVVINVQGDEPFIEPSQIKELMHCFDDASTQIATLAKKFKTDETEADLFNENQPKLVVNINNDAMYFSRSVIPFVRGSKPTDWISRQSFYKHVGVYAYRSEVLAEITVLKPSLLEKAESLEQLRCLENGYKIKIGFTDAASIGIDTPEDLEKVQHRFK